MSTMQRIALAARPQGAPKESDFRLEDASMPEAGPGEILVRVIWLSLDPYMRGRMDDSKSYADSVGIGDTMEAGAVGEVIVSNHPNFASGDFAVGRFGWATHGVVPGDEAQKVDPAHAPLSTRVGVLGMPGLTAFVGLMDFGRPKAGETLVVGAATGAVGSVVGQLAKAQGLRVVGVAGGADKCTYATEKLGFDSCLDHRAYADARALKEALAAEAPDGVDIYFENVGGKTLNAVMPLMNVHGRIPVCGMISWYSGDFSGGNEPDPFPKFWRSILVNRISVCGFIIFDHYERAGDFIKTVGPMIADGRVSYRETIADGLANAPAAFIEMLKGGNFGKQLVAVSDDPTR